MNDMPDCKCGTNDWFAIPDSLAAGCKNCGRVLVSTGPNSWEKGASIQEWLNDYFQTDVHIDPDAEERLNDHFETDIFNTTKEEE